MTHTTRRNFLSLTLLGVTSLALAACAPGDGPGTARETVPTDVPVEGPRILIVYFSVPLTDNPDNMSRDEANSTHVVDGAVLGNTQYVAQLIQGLTGAEMFRIETADPLPLDFDVLEAQALREQEANVLPELAALVPNLADYDTIYLGYPIYWYDLPMPVYTFLNEHDLAGKTVIPFSTHGGSRLSGTVEVLTGALATSTVVQNAFTISRDDMDNAPSEVETWFASLT